MRFSFVVFIAASASFGLQAAAQHPFPPGLTWPSDAKIDAEVVCQSKVDVKVEVPSHEARVKISLGSGLRFEKIEINRIIPGRPKAEIDAKIDALRREQKKRKPIGDPFEDAEHDGLELADLQRQLGPKRKLEFSYDVIGSK